MKRKFFYIKYYDTFNNGYNCTEGGEGRSGATNNENQRKASSKAVIKNNKDRKDKNRSLINKYYNFNLTVKENYENIINNEGEISERTLYRFCKENNIKTSKNTLTDDELLKILDVNLSIRKNLEILKDSDIKISKDRISKLLNILKNK